MSILWLLFPFKLLNIKVISCQHMQEILRKLTNPIPVRVNGSFLNRKVSESKMVLCPLAFLFSRDNLVICWLLYDIKWPFSLFQDMLLTNYYICKKCFKFIDAREFLYFQIIELSYSLRYRIYYGKKFGPQIGGNAALARTNFFGSLLYGRHYLIITTSMWNESIISRY